MKFDTLDFKHAYLQEIIEVVEKQNKIQNEAFLNTWKDKWVIVDSSYGELYGKVDSCDFSYQYDTGELSLNLILLQPDSKPVYPIGVTSIVEMSEKQKTFLELYILVKNSYDVNDDIKDLVKLLSPTDIKGNE